MYVKVSVIFDGYGIYKMEGELDPIIRESMKMADKHKVSEFVIKCQTKRHIFGVWKKKNRRWIREW